MILSGPSAANVAPAVTVPAPISAAQVVVTRVEFDLIAGTYRIAYGLPGQPSRVASGAIPANVLTAVETHAQRAIEADQAWANGSSTVVAP